MIMLMVTAKNAKGYISSPYDPIIHPSFLARGADYTAVGKYFWRSHSFLWVSHCTFETKECFYIRGMHCISLPPCFNTAYRTVCSLLAV